MTLRTFKSSLICTHTYSCIQQDSKLLVHSTKTRTIDLLLSITKRAVFTELKFFNVIYLSTTDWLSLQLFERQGFSKNLIINLSMWTHTTGQNLEQVIIFSLVVHNIVIVWGQRENIIAVKFMDNIQFQFDTRKMPTADNVLFCNNIYNVLFFYQNFCPQARPESNSTMNDEH